MGKILSVNIKDTFFLEILRWIALLAKAARSYKSDSKFLKEIIFGWKKKQQKGQKQSLNNPPI